MSTSHDALGRLLREAREKRGLGVVEVARAVNKSHTFISRLEAGQLPLTNAETIRALADVLGLTPDDIYAAGGTVPADLSAKLRSLDARGLGQVRAYLDRIATAS